MIIDFCLLLDTQVISLDIDELANCKSISGALPRLCDLAIWASFSYSAIAALGRLIVDMATLYLVCYP